MEYILPYKQMIQLKTDLVFSPWFKSFTVQYGENMPYLKDKKESKTLIERMMTRTERILLFSIWNRMD